MMFGNVRLVHESDPDKKLLFTDGALTGARHRRQRTTREGESTKRSLSGCKHAAKASAIPALVR